IYPGVGLTLVCAPDAEYLYACCRAYNDWLAEFCRPYPDRLKGVGLIPCRGPVGWAVAETERCAKLGLVSVMLPAWVDDQPYNMPDWDPLWAALQDMGLVASMHIGGREPFGRAHGPGAGGIIIGVVKFEMNDTLQRLIWGGAPVRFPKLKWALVESGIGWIGAALGFMDHWWHDHKGWMEPPRPAEQVFSPAVLRHVRGRPGRHPDPRADGRRELDVGLGLPAHRRRVAVLAQAGGAELRRDPRGRHPQDGPRQRPAVVRVST